jgi:hypothetical protein
MKERTRNLHVTVLVQVWLLCDLLPLTPSGRIVQERAGPGEGGLVNV